MNNDKNDGDPHPPSNDNDNDDSDNLQDGDVLLEVVPNLNHNGAVDKDEAVAVADTNVAGEALVVAYSEHQESESPARQQQQQPQQQQQKRKATTNNNENATTTATATDTNTTTTTGTASTNMIAKRLCFFPGCTNNKAVNPTTNPGNNEALQVLSKMGHDWIDVDARPKPGNVLVLTTWPNAFLEKDHASCQEIINQAMLGVTRKTVEAVDGFGYHQQQQDLSQAPLDMNLCMLAAMMDSVVVLKDWVNNRWGVGILQNRGSVRSLWSPLIHAVAARAHKARDFILSCYDENDENRNKNDITERETLLVMGIPEAAALGRKELTYKLVDAYDQQQQCLPHHDKHPDGLTGAQQAYLFSALSGDTQWVQYWMDRVGNEDIHVGSTLSIGSVLHYAVRGGNPELVRILLVDKGFPRELPHDLNPLLACALADVKMVKFMVEELGFSLDAMGEDRRTMLEAALQGRYTETCLYLLEKVPGPVWADMSVTEHPLATALHSWISPQVCLRLLQGGLSKGDAQHVLRVAIRFGNHRVARYLMESGGGGYDDYGGGTTYYTKHSKSCTLFEQAILSGSLQTINLLLEKNPSAWDYVHSNGFNPLVAAVQSGSAIVFSKICQLHPDRLTRPFFNSCNVLMASAQYMSPGAFQTLLDKDFYDQHCRGKLLDVNNKDDNQRTVLYHAVISGVVDFVEKLLSDRKWYGIKECEVQNAVNDLYVQACRKEAFMDILECFERHGLILEGVASASLAMTAAEAGVLFFSPPSALDKLRAMDRKVQMNPSDEILLRAIISNASEWAIETQRLANLVRHFFLGKPCISSSEAVLSQVLARCDLRLGELFGRHALLGNSAMKVGDRSGPYLAVVKILEAISKKDACAHATVIGRREKFVSWIMGDDGVPCEPDQAFALIEKAVKAHLPLHLIKALFSADVKFSKEKLCPVILQAAETCQHKALKFLVTLLKAPATLADIKSKTGQTIITAVLSEGKVKCAGSFDRLPMVQWLLDNYKIDLSVRDSDGMTVPMRLAFLGHVGLVDFLSNKFDKDLISAKTDREKSIVMYACKSGHPRVLSWAMSLTDPSLHLGPKGETALHDVAYFGYFGMVRFLVQVLQADVNAKDTSGRTAMAFAELGYHGKIQEFLKSVGGPSAEGSIPGDSPSRRQVTEWLREIGRSRGKSMCLDANGVSSFTVDEYTFAIEVPQQSRSFFIMYSILDGKKYEIGEDAWKVLLRLAQPVNDFNCSLSLDPQSSKGGNILDACVSICAYVNEYDQKGFLDLLEKFIDLTVETGNHMKACAARKALGEAFEKRGLEVTPGQFSRLTANLGEYLVETKHSEPLSAQDIEVFRGTLQIFLDELGHAIGVSLPADANGSCAFVDGDLTIAIQPASATRFRLSVTLKTCHGESPPAWVLRRTLELNYLQQETRYGSIYMKNRGDNLPSTWDFVYVYENSLHQVVCTAFRNIIENFIDTALTLHGVLQNPPLDELVPLPSWDNSNHVIGLKALRSGMTTTVSTILSLPEDLLKKDLMDLLTKVGKANDAELFSAVCQAVVSDPEHDKMETILVSVLPKMFEYGLICIPTLTSMAKSKPKKFFSTGLFEVCKSRILLEKKQSSEIAKLIFNLANEAGLNEQDRKAVVDKHGFDDSLNLIYIVGSDTIMDEVFACLDLLVEPGTNSARSFELLHNAASKGNIQIIEYLLGRLEGLSLDEQTLIWSCRSAKKDLTEFILSRAPDLPRGKAILVATSGGNTAILELLLAPSASIEKREIPGSDGLCEHLFTAAQTAIAGQKWKALKLLTADDRLSGRTRELLDYACVCGHPRQAVKILLSSPIGQWEAYSLKLPWAAQAVALKQDVLPFLFLKKAKGLTIELTDLIWSFAKRGCEASPVVSSPDAFWDQARTALTVDLDIRPITRIGNSFELPEVAKVTFNGCLKIKKRFDIDGVGVTAESLLSISEHLGGCFLATNRPTESVHLKRVIPLDPNLNYHNLRSVIGEFRRISRIIDLLLAHFRSTKIIEPANKLSFVAPDLLNFLPKGFSQMSQMRSRGDLEFAYTVFDQLRPTRARFSIELADQNVDAPSLLAANMNLSDGFFYGKSVSTDKLFICTFASPDNDDEWLVTKLGELSSSVPVL